jgi:hypothetical protein
MLIPRVAKSLNAVELKLTWSAWQLATVNTPALADALRASGRSAPTAPAVAMTRMAGRLCMRFSFLG